MWIKVLNREKGGSVVQGPVASVIVLLDTWETWTASCQAAEGRLVSDEIPEGDNIVGGRPADDKRILRTHLFLCHFAETGAGPHFTQMHLLFELQARGGSAIQIIEFLGQILTSGPLESGHATFQACRCSDSNKPPRTKRLGMWRHYKKVLQVDFGAGGCSGTAAP